MLEDKYDAVVFDAFGTLVRIGTRLSPYRRLQKAMVEHGRPIHPSDALTMMTVETGLAGIAHRCGARLPISELVAIEEDLYRELSTITLFDDALPTIAELRRRNTKIAICSNLAAPYGAVVTTLLPKLDAYAWSFRVGAAKPDPRIYTYVAGALDCRPARILFVGDTPAADVIGPRAAGMQAIHLDRDTTVPGTISSLHEVLK